MGSDRKRLTAAEQAPFLTLVKMIERELELAGQGRVQELRAAVTKTGAFMATLPAPAPESARGLVERAKALRGRVTIETRRLEESIRLSRVALRRARLVARKYSQQQGNRYSTTA